MRRRAPIVRDWSEALEKVQEEGACRGCGRSDVRLEAAHTLGRDYDEELLCVACEGTGEGRRIGTKCSKCRGHGTTRKVSARLVVPLCGPATSTGTCHGQHHARKLDLLTILTGDEQLAAVEIIVRRAEAIGQNNVGIAEAYRRLSGSREPPVVAADKSGSLPIAHIPGQTTVYDMIENPPNG